MADKDHFEPIKGPIEFGIELLVIFFIALFLFQGIQAKFGGSDGTGFFHGVKTLFSGARNTIVGSESATETARALGARITQSRPTILYDLPGGEALQGIAAGVFGTIIGGPSVVDGLEWWQVKFDDGVEGWIVGTSFIAEGEATLGDIAESSEGPLASFYRSFVVVSTGISLLLLIGILYSVIRLFQLRQEEEERLHGGHHTDTHVHEDDTASEPTQKTANKTRWEVIQMHANSASESDRRLAILEADIFLDDVLKAQGFIGETLGERLKGLSRGDIRTLDQAWEAHKIRNAIAHEGVNFPLSEREARRIIGLYGEVFKEFDYI